MANHILGVHELFKGTVGGAVLAGNDEGSEILLGYTFCKFCHQKCFAYATRSVDEADTILQNATVHGEAFSLNNTVGGAVLAGNDEATAILLGQSAVA